MRKLLSIVGVRPQFVKAAMLCASIERWNAACAPEDRVQHLLLNTGQHYDFEMAEIFFRQLPLPSPAAHVFLLLLSPPAPIEHRSHTCRHLTDTNKPRPP